MHNTGRYVVHGVYWGRRIGKELDEHLILGYNKPGEILYSGTS